MGKNASAPTVQLQIVRVVLGVIAYRKLNFRVSDVSRPFLRSVRLKRDTGVKLPVLGGKGNSDWDLLKPLYGVSTECKYRYEAIRDFLPKECG